MLHKVQNSAIQNVIHIVRTLNIRQTFHGRPLDNETTLQSTRLEVALTTVHAHEAIHLLLDCCLRKCNRTENTVSIPHLVYYYVLPVDGVQE